MSVWDVISTRPNWERIGPADGRAKDAAKAANGQYWFEVLADVRHDPNTAAFNTPYGVCILRDEGDEVCVVSFLGHSYGDAFEELRAVCIETGWDTFRIHTDNQAILRYWRKLGMVPTEYIYRETVHG